MRRFLLSLSLLGLLFVAAPASADTVPVQAQDQALGVTTVQESIKTSVPRLEIHFPGVSFSPPSTTLDQDGYLSIPFVGEFLSAMYRYAMVVGSILAVIMVIVAGAQIVISAGGEEKQAAYHRISQVVIGLILLWGSYAVLYTINPTLVTFKPLKVKYIEPIVLEDEEEVTTAENAAADIVQVTGQNIRANKGTLLSETVLAEIQQVAKTLGSEDITLFVASGFRSPDDQRYLIKQNCKNPPGSDTCDPLPGHAITCILKGNDPKNCPHTTGRAVDIWGMKDGKQCVMQKQCSSNKATDPCRKDPCQAEVIRIMKQAGFCNLDKEAWHFEKPKMSSKCS